MWDAVVGQESPKLFLAKIIQSQSLGPALLFTGPAGIGKRTLAREFAASLLGCAESHLPNHPDFVLVEQELGVKAIALGQIKALAEQAVFAPTQSKYKVCLIDGAESMTGEAANSLLKLLEEPPAFWQFILLSTSTEKLLPTILSRVVQLRLQPLTQQQVQQLLEAQGVASAKELAELAEGSVGRALELQELDALGKQEQLLSFLQGLPRTDIVNYILAQAWLPKDSRDDKQKSKQREVIFLLDLLLSQLHRHIVSEQSWQGISPRALRRSVPYVTQALQAVRSATGFKSVLETLFIQLNECWKEQ